MSKLYDYSQTKEIDCSLIQNYLTDFTTKMIHEEKIVFYLCVDMRCNGWHQNGEYGYPLHNHSQHEFHNCGVKYFFVTNFARTFEFEVCAHMHYCTFENTLNFNGKTARHHHYNEENFWISPQTIEYLKEQERKSDKSTRSHQKIKYFWSYMQQNKSMENLKMIIYSFHHDYLKSKLKVKELVDLIFEYKKEM